MVEDADGGVKACLSEEDVVKLREIIVRCEKVEE